MWLHLIGSNRDSDWSVLGLDWPFRFAANYYEGLGLYTLHVMALTEGLPSCGKGFEREWCSCLHPRAVSAEDSISWFGGWLDLTLKWMCMDTSYSLQFVSVAYFLGETIILCHVIKLCTQNNNHCFTNTQKCEFKGWEDGNGNNK